MPEKLDIMHAIREGLDAINFPPRPDSTKRTRLVLAKLCDIGQEQFRCYVCTNQAHAPNAENRGWLYDMVWLEYTSHLPRQAMTTGWLIDTHLVAESEWGSFERVEGALSKLMLARAGIRLMICRDTNNGDDLASRLAEWVRRFNATRAEDAYLLAVLCWDAGVGAYRFRYFTLGLNGALPFRGRDARG